MERASNKKVTIFAIILSLAAIGVLVFGFMLVSSNKVVMLQSISNLYGKITDISEDDAILLDKLSESNDIGIKGNVNLKLKKDEYSFNYDYLENKKDSKSSLIIDGKRGKKDILNGNFLIEDNNLYLFFKDITQNYYKIAIDYTSIFKSISSDDYEKIVLLLKDAIDSSIKNDDILKEKTTIEYNGKDKKVNKLTYIFTNKKIEEALTKFVKSVKSDKTLINNIANSLGISSKELNKQLDDGLKLVKELKDKELFRYQIYYYGFNKIVQYELYNKEYDLLLRYKTDEKETLSLTSNNYNYFNIEISKNKQNYAFNGTILDNYNFNGTLSENLFELIFKLDKEYKLDVVYSKDNSENSFKHLYQITLSSINNEKEKELFLIDANLEYYFGEKIDNSIDVSNAMDLDVETLNNLLQTNFGITLEDLRQMF